MVQGKARKVKVSRKRSIASEAEISADENLEALERAAEQKAESAHREKIPNASGKAADAKNENGNNKEALLLESDGNGGHRAHDSVLLEPRYLGTLGNELSIKIVQELAKEPLCAMDIAKRLKLNARHGEQKIYYHIRKLEKAGIVKQVGTENRYGMVAKIFNVVAPVIATRLWETNGTPVEKVVKGVVDPKLSEFLRPFIVNGNLNSTIIIGSPWPHGRFDATARDTPELLVLGAFLGKFVRGNAITYKLDTQISEDDLKNNLILIGNSKINTVVDRINSYLPIYFDEKSDWVIRSKLSGNAYKDDNHAAIIRMQNPFNKKKEVLILAGRRSVGLRAAVLALVHHHDEIMKGNSGDYKAIAKVVEGRDRDSDGKIDAVKFLE